MVFWLQATADELEARRGADDTVFEKPEFQEGLGDAYRAWFDNYEQAPVQQIAGGDIESVHRRILSALSQLVKS